MRLPAITNVRGVGASWLGELYSNTLCARHAHQRSWIALMSTSASFFLEEEWSGGYGAPEFQSDLISCSDSEGRGLG